MDSTLWATEIDDGKKFSTGDKWTSVGWLFIFPSLIVFMAGVAIIRSCIYHHKKSKQQVPEVKTEPVVSATRREVARTTRRDRRRGSMPAPAPTPFIPDQNWPLPDRVPERAQTRGPGESSSSTVPVRRFHLPAADIQEPQSVAQSAGRARVDSVEELPQNAELPPSYDVRSQKLIPYS